MDIPVTPVMPAVPDMSVMPRFPHAEPAALPAPGSSFPDMPAVPAPGSSFPDMPAVSAPGSSFPDMSVMPAAPARPAVPAMPVPPVRGYCPHREWSAGRRDFGPDIPESAQGEYFPGNEPGPYCELSGESCDPHPGCCPLWKPSALPCPACLEFERRRWPVSLFRESRLLAVLDKDGQFARNAPRSRPLLHCPRCEEEYADLPALLEMCLNRLRDALDDCDHFTNLVAELRDSGGYGAGKAML